MESVILRLLTKFLLPFLHHITRNPLKPAKFLEQISIT